MPSDKEISYMEKLKNIMEGKNTPPATANVRNNINQPELPKEINIDDDMKSILERFNRNNNTQHTPVMETKTHNIHSEKYNIDDIVDNMPSILNSPEPNRKNNYSNNISESYNIVVELYPGSKVRKLYSIVGNNGSLTKYNNLNMFESAQLILENLMTSKNINLSDILAKDKEYGDLIKESMFYRTKVDKCKQLNEHEAGKILEGKSVEITKRANSIQKQLRNSISTF